MWVQMCYFLVNTNGAFTHTVEWTRGEAGEKWLQHKSLHAFTHMRLCRGDRAGAKSSLQQMAPTPNFSRPLLNCVAQTKMAGPPVSQSRMCEHNRWWNRDVKICLSPHGHCSTFVWMYLNPVCHQWATASAGMDMPEGPETLWLA